MSAASLLDTNVLVYSLDSSNVDKYQRAWLLVETGVQAGDSCIPQQVVNETLNVAIGKLDFTEDEAMHLLRTTLLPLHQEIPMLALFSRGVEVRFRYRYGFYGLMVIAAALELGCTTLYSEDLQHGQRIEGLTIENPFL